MCMCIKSLNFFIILNLQPPLFKPLILVWYSFAINSQAHEKTISTEYLLCFKHFTGQTDTFKEQLHVVTASLQVDKTKA